MLSFDGVLHLQRCSLHRWIPVNTVSGRWQAAGWKAVGWRECCEKSRPWWCKGYVTGKQRLQTTNTDAFYWWQFGRAEIFWWDPQAHCPAVHLRSFAIEEWPNIPLATVNNSMWWRCVTLTFFPKNGLCEVFIMSNPSNTCKIILFNKHVPLSLPVKWMDYFSKGRAHLHISTRFMGNRTSYICLLNL